MVTDTDQVQLLTFRRARGELRVEVEGVVGARHGRLERRTDLSPEELLQDREVTRISL